MQSEEDEWSDGKVIVIVVHAVVIVVVGPVVVGFQNRACD